MIIFDGIDLASVANVKIEDINVGPIQQSPVARARVIQGGAQFIRPHDGTRIVTVTFQVPEENPVVREQNVLNITAWAKQYPCKLELPFAPDKYLMAACTELPNPSARQWWQILRLSFTCFDPYWISKAEKSVACGTQFVALGDAPPIARIERTLSASASDQSYTLGSNTIAFSTIPAGDMVIDLDRQTAQVGNNSIMQYYNVNSKWLVPAVGVQTITGTGTVKWRERWR